VGGIVFPWEDGRRDGEEGKLLLRGRLVGERRGEERRGEEGSSIAAWLVWSTATEMLRREREREREGMCVCV
jgi:hypothetical protein